MRFQTSKIIQREDPQVVLRALELSFRQIDLDVVRDGSEMILHGLGPSPRVINPRDAAVLRVETEDHRTVIHADVTFHPSCLLGESPQTEAVSYKLDRIFDQMSAEIALEQQRKPNPVDHLPESPTPAATESINCVPAPLQLLEKAPPISPSRIDPPQTLATPSTYVRILLIAITCIVVLYSGYLMTHRRTHINAPVNLTIPQPTTTASSAARVADPRDLLGNWVAAMRTRDAVAQASFYADHVENYLGRKNISNAELIAQKKAEIDRRTGLWTIKLQELVLVKESATSVKVNLVKHSITQTRPAHVSERFIKCRLHLKRIHGQWKIVSEEDVL